MRCKKLTPSTQRLLLIIKMMEMASTTSSTARRISAAVAVTRRFPFAKSAGI